MPDDRTVFARMEPFQRAAASSLVKSGHFASEEWKHEEIYFSEASVPVTMAQRVSEANGRMRDVSDILCEILDRYPLRGKHGLKDRTKLMEYRYDPV